jgi:maltokinase
MSGADSFAQTAAALWWPVVSQARWFQGKSRDGSPVGLWTYPYLVDTVGLRVRSEVLLVGYGDPADDGEIEAYHLLVAYRAQPTGGPAVVGTLTVDGQSCEVSDAPRDPAAMAALLPALTTAHTYGPDSDGNVVVTRVIHALPAGDLTPRVFTGEQSNTNVIYGDTALLKVFRKVESGPNLDREITDRLVRAGVHDVPVLYGWVEADLGSDPGYPDDLMMLTELLPDPVDGWGLACESCRTGGDFSADAAALGRALGQVHAALADDHAPQAGDAVADMMSRRLVDAVAAAPALAPYESGLAGRIDALRGRELPVQSVHGDFHLGQTLRTALGWRIIDFEGEPLKSMAERRTPDSPWRDVAGMLRSLSYATSAAADPHGTEVAAWLRTARDAFLTAYRETAGIEPDATVLTAYEADKAAYEVVYETRNRPDWVHIPLGAVEAMTNHDRQPRS